MQKFPWAALGLLFLSLPVPVVAQQVTVGEGFGYRGDHTSTGVETGFNLFFPANTAGQVVRAYFGWSHSPCAGAAKIKFFRPKPSSDGRSAFSFLTERGPFDVTEVPTLYPPIIQTVGLIPPVLLEPGDIIAITSLTQCGGPTFNFQRVTPIPLAPSASFFVSGDVVSDVQEPSDLNTGIFLYALGVDPGSLLLLGRFQVTLNAIDPRSGQRTTGVPNPLGAAAGYFSLPDFTGDATFPEVMVKMVDATTAPSLGGDFWFFHAPLTDVQYTITVMDESTGAVRTYSNTEANAGQLCGAADTAAFPGPSHR